MSKLRFLWIDDDPNRAAESKNLAKSLGVAIKFENVKDKSLDDVLDRIMSEKLPDLIMLDHKLEDAITGIFKTGSTAAESIREKWPECPIVCITGMSKGEVDSRKLALYEELFEINKISKYGTYILAIAKAFNKIKKNPPSDVDDILKLLKAPKEDYERLKSIMPHELKTNFGDKGLLTSVSSWTRKILIDRPGFLYDRLWIATLLGIKVASFKKVEAHFAPAKYTGVFQNESQERWWKSKVLVILSKMVDASGLPWHKGRYLPNIVARDFSRCYSSNDFFPETVAYTDQTSTAKLAPMKLKHTVAHPDYTEMLFFEEIRIMKPAEE